MPNMIDQNDPRYEFIVDAAGQRKRILRDGASVTYPFDSWILYNARSPSKATVLPTPVLSTGLPLMAPASDSTNRDFGSRGRISPGILPTPLLTLLTMLGSVPLSTTSCTMLKNLGST